MCLNPKWIYKKGFYKENNYRGAKGDFYEIGTYSKCGHCEVCINEKSNNWVVRNYYEEKAHQKKCFITLTYRNSPIIIIKKDLQDFMKRLRIHLDRTTGEKIRMYACQEYGERNNRPHAHVIIYGWEDKNKKYLGINRKKSILYQSEIIQKVWGLGRTSYQEFNEKEVPYISLYNTSKETYKKAYIINRKKLKRLEEYFMYTQAKFDKNQYKNIQEELKNLRIELDKSKKQYLAIREYNTWSIALGWDEFYKRFDDNNYVYQEYIEDKEFATPSPWVKKLANMGYISASEEMKRREEEIIQSANEEEEIRKNLIKIEMRRKKDLEDYQTQTKDGDILINI